MTLLRRHAATTGQIFVVNASGRMKGIGEERAHALLISGTEKRMAAGIHQEFLPYFLEALAARTPDGDKILSLEIAHGPKLDISPIVNGPKIKDGDTIIVDSGNAIILIIASEPLTKRVTIVAQLQFFHPDAQVKITKAGGKAIYAENVQGFSGTEVLVGQ